MAEARCWVLRDRAWTRKGSGLFLLGSQVQPVVGWIGWLGPALTKLLVGSLDGCVVSLDGVSLWWVVLDGLVVLPVF